MANGRHNGRGRGDTKVNRYWEDTMARGDTMALFDLLIEQDGHNFNRYRDVMTKERITNTNS